MLLFFIQVVLCPFLFMFYVAAVHRTILIGYSTVLCKIGDFICTSLRSTEIVLDERNGGKKKSANKIQYFTLHCRMTVLSYILINKSMSEMGLTARTIAKAYQSLRLGHKPLLVINFPCGG